MWVVDILTGMQTKTTSANVGFDGNWLSIFNWFRLKGGKHMLVSSETRKVEWKHRSCSSRCVNQTNDLH